MPREQFIVREFKTSSELIISQANEIIEEYQADINHETNTERRLFDRTHAQQLRVVT